MYINKFCKEKCPHFTDKCKEMETEADKKWHNAASHGFSRSDSICWCCANAGTKCKKYEWTEIPSWVTAEHKPTLNGNDTVIVECERFKRG